MNHSMRLLRKTTGTCKRSLNYSTCKLSKGKIRNWV